MPFECGRRLCCGLAGIIGTLVTVTPIGAQQIEYGNVAPNAAKNLADFDFVTATVEQNYAGWGMGRGHRRGSLAKLTFKLRAQAAAADDVVLEQVLKRWLGFFHDRNLAVGLMATGAEVAPSIAGLDWTADGVRAYLNDVGRMRAPVEGVWRIAGGRSLVAVVRDPGAAGHFVGVQIASTEGRVLPGQVKARFAQMVGGGFAVVYLHGDLMIEHQTADLVAGGTVLAPSNGVNWTREWPVVTDPDVTARQFTSGDLFLKQIDASTLWLRVPDFGDFQRQALAALLQANATAIAKTPHMIIDLRNNRVGAQDVADQLLPLVYMRPIKVIGVAFRSTEQNRKLRQVAADKIRPIAPDAARVIDRQIAGDGSGGSAPAFFIKSFPEVLPYPRRVAILIDGAGGIAEQFILEARQSTKVTLVGQFATSGALDFYDTVAVRTPSGRYRLRWGTTRSRRLPQHPIDRDGIEPDVVVPKADQDPIAFAARLIARAGR